MRAVLAKKRGQAAEVMAFTSVKGEDGQKGAHRLPIFGMSRIHLGWSLRSAGKGE